MFHLYAFEIFKNSAKYLKAKLQITNFEKRNWSATASDKMVKLGFSLSDEMIAGAFAGVVARIISAPFDVLKIRSQLQIDNNEAAKKTVSVVQGFQQIIKNEGFFALWKGNLSATYLWITYAAVQFTVYGTLKRLGESYLDSTQGDTTNPSNNNKSKHTNNNPKLSRALVLFLAGAGAGLSSTVATYPFDIMRTQFALQGNKQIYPTIKSFVTETFQKKGIAGFYAGLTPAVIGITPYMGLNFALYETMKMLIIVKKQSLPSPSSSSFIQPIIEPVDIIKQVPSPLSFSSSLSYENFRHKYAKEIDGIQEMIQKFMCGGIAGGLSKLAVYPLDTVKKRLQAQVLYTTLDGNVGQLILPKYRGIGHCLTRIIADEGVRGLYRGIIPTVLKSVVATSVTFVAYEAAKDILQLRRQEQEESATATTAATAAGAKASKPSVEESNKSIPKLKEKMTNDL